MKYINKLFTLLFILLFSQIGVSQTDFSENWKDLYSYNNVQDFTVINGKIYGASNHALFIYDIENGEIEKISSVNGLSGDEIESISFDATSNRVVLGYGNGLIEIITNESKVIPVTGIRDNLILVNRAVKGFYRKDEVSYLFGEFGILIFDIENSQIGDSYRLSLDSTPGDVNQLVVNNDVLYAATSLGLYSISLSLNAGDFNNWTQVVSGNVADVLNISDEIFFSKDSDVFELSNPTSSIFSDNNEVLSINVYNSDKNYLNVTTATDIFIIDPSDFTVNNSVDLSLATDYDIVTTKSIIIGNDVFVNTSISGILKTSLNDKINYEELHPDGPSANDIFSITVAENQKWVVYGGYDDAFGDLKRRRSVDYFFNDTWNSIDPSEFGNTDDFVKVIIDPKDNSRVLAASVLDGIVEFNNFEHETTWFSENTDGVLPGHATVGGAWTTNMIVDNNDNIWTANSRAFERSYFTKYNGEEQGVDRWDFNISFLNVTGTEFVRGFREMYVDQNNNVFTASEHDGVFVFNADSPDKRVILNTSSNQGGLPSNVIHSVVADENEKVWIGTDSGLVVFDDYNNLYATNKQSAQNVIIEEGDNAQFFLSDVVVNDILIDEANNKWFATDSGVFHTSSSGEITFNIFTSSNSPLPEDEVIDLEIEESTGLIYMVTNKGVLVYDSESDPFADSITSVVAYPNPAIGNKLGHETIFFVAKDGNGIPDGTNVKILDVSGRLVFETNVIDNGESQGGNFSWDKRNLRGNLVVSGVYIVLLSSPDGSENTTTKVAIVN